MSYRPGNQYDYFNQILLNDDGSLSVSDRYQNDILLDIQDLILNGNQELATILMGLILNSQITNQSINDTNNLLRDILSKEIDLSVIENKLNNLLEKDNYPNIILPTPPEVRPIVIVDVDCNKGYVRYDCSKRKKIKKDVYDYYRRHNPGLSCGEEKVLLQLPIVEPIVDQECNKRISTWKDIHKYDLKNRQTKW